MSVDNHNGSEKWSEAIKLDTEHQHEYGTCKDVGKSPPPKGHMKIRDHFAFDVKHDLRNKATLVADGNLTYVPL